MSKNGNGFAEMADYFGTLSKTLPNLKLKDLEKAALFYVKELLPVIPVALQTKKHMKDHVKVSVEKDKVVVHFEDTAFYWRFPENGTVHQKAQHFASGTYEQNREKIEDLMTKQLLKELRG